MTTVDEARATVARRLRTQAVQAVELQSPLYAELLERAAADVENGGPVWSVLEGHEGDPGASALALRLVGSVHRLVLEGRLPDLAVHYPSVGGDGDAEAAWPPFLAAMEAHRDELREAVNRPVQTNEVRRCAALLGGFLEVAKATGMPLRVLEAGASAGLNLRFDSYGYRQDGRTWGDPSSPVQLEDPWVGGVPDLEVEVTVAERAGCDAAPIDPTSEDGQLTLRSFVWPDQMHRHRMLDAAFKVASRVPATVDKADVPVWLEERLADPAPGVATVVFHSVVIQYLPPAGRERAIEVLEDAGRRATPDAPLAWLRMEPSRERDFAVELTTWPGGDHRLLGRCGGHGPPVRWLI
jgi:hypothetical protein